MVEKININPRAMMYPAQAVIASAYDADKKADACTLAFARMCSHFPRIYNDSNQFNGQT